MVQKGRGQERTAPQEGVPNNIPAQSVHGDHHEPFMTGRNGSAYKSRAGVEFAPQFFTCEHITRINGRRTIRKTRRNYRRASHPHCRVPGGRDILSLPEKQWHRRSRLSIFIDGIVVVTTIHGAVVEVERQKESP
jgi:hypothetical protein